MYSFSITFFNCLYNDIKGNLLLSIFQNCLLFSKILDIFLVNAITRFKSFIVLKNRMRKRFLFSISFKQLEDILIARRIILAVAALFK